MNTASSPPSIQHATIPGHNYNRHNNWRGPLHLMFPHKLPSIQRA